MLYKIRENTDGVEEAKVSLEEKIAKIKYDETQVNLDKIKETIKDAGFETK